MLTALTIKNFTLVDQLEIDFSSGMTAITGETGAGKSLVLGALSMALGDRADTDNIRRGTERAEVAAVFDIEHSENARLWLTVNDFENDGCECLLKRVITNEGRSRGSINGQSATMSQLRVLGEMLIDIHSQHEHQSLLRKETHIEMLDDYASSSELAAKVKQHYQNWHEISQRLEELESHSDELAARKDLVRFQLEELNQLALVEGEFPVLEQEQQLLANAESILQESHTVLDICSRQEDFNLQQALSRALLLLQGMAHKPDTLKEAEKLLSSATIEIDEACREIQNHLDSFELNPERLQQVEDRLSAIFQLARKHRVQPTELYDKQAELSAELHRLDGGDTDIDALKEQLDALSKTYQKNALKLSAVRKQAAASLAESVSAHFESLSMSGALFIPQITPLPDNSHHAKGLETVEFLITTNPGEPPRPLAKIASGGELSRISLAIQVVIAHHSTIPSLVFDEVDVGIGGRTADVVGKLLRQLGHHGQVICVTHQPQVAACAHQHFLVSKQTHDDHAESYLDRLAQDGKEKEIARMLGGAKITERTLANAREMLELATQ